MRTPLLLILVLLLISGCGKKYTSHLYDDTVRGSRVDAVRLSTADANLSRLVKAMLQKRDIAISDRALLTLQAEATTYSHHCNNPLTCSYDATYDGFVKLTLMRQMHPLYMVQSDYHGRLTPKLLESLWEQMTEELELR
ncbi:MAG TPA: hypothetical protein ENK93_00465 [Campylobacteraceae bacterium]|nr:hypothetical protein [Campylobacteraceae bacterium]